MPHLIGIAGPSGAGKTELARRLSSLLAAPVVSLDWYYRDLGRLPSEERACSNFDVPEALDHNLLLDHLRLLASGSAIQAPVYDFATHTRFPHTIPIEARDFAIFEGLFTLHWEDVRALLNTRVFVATEDPVCFERRLDRDVRERGRSPESVRLQYDTTVRPMAERYILPACAFADVIVSGVDPVERSAAAVLAHLARKPIR